METSTSSPKGVQEEVGTDGDTKLGFWWDPGFEERAFGIVMSDGGGYSSLWLRPHDWEEIKVKMDALIAKHVKP